MVLPTLPSPTTLLVGLVLIGLSFAGGAYVGKEYEAGENAKEKVNEFTSAFDKIEKLVESDKTLAIEQAEKAAIAKERARTARAKGVNDAVAKAVPACDRDAVSVGLLNDAIDAANGAPGSPSSVRGTVPTATQTSGRDGQSSAGLGVRLN